MPAIPGHNVTTIDKGKWKEGAPRLDTFTLTSTVIF